MTKQVQRRQIHRKIRIKQQILRAKRKAAGREPTEMIYSYVGADGVIYKGRVIL